MGHVYVLTSFDSRIIYGVFSTPSKAMAARASVVGHYVGSNSHGKVTQKDFNIRPMPLDEAFWE